MMALALLVLSHRRAGMECSYRGQFVEVEVLGEIIDLRPLATQSERARGPQ